MNNVIYSPKKRKKKNLFCAIFMETMTSKIVQNICHRAESTKFVSQTISMSKPCR